MNFILQHEPPKNFSITPADEEPGDTDMILTPEQERALFGDQKKQVNITKLR